MNLGAKFCLQGTHPNAVVYIAALDELHRVLSHASRAVVQEQDFGLVVGVVAAQLL